VLDIINQVLQEPVYKVVASMLSMYQSMDLVVALEAESVEE
jgi:hypothetical protein